MSSESEPSDAGALHASSPLSDRIAVVAGATRGAGRGIARALGEVGATVYCTGRSVRGALSDYERPETIEETAELIQAAGGARRMRCASIIQAKPRSSASSQTSMHGTAGSTCSSTASRASIRS